MAQFTQLNLSGEPDRKSQGKPESKPSRNIARADQRIADQRRPEERPRSNGTKLSGKQKTAAVVGSGIATLLLVVFLLQSSGCSKGTGRSDQATANQAGSNQATLNQATSSQQAAMATTASNLPSEAAAQKPAQKKPRQRKLLASTYANPAYGVSFRYPKYDSLKEGDKANLQWAGLGPVEMNFVQPGGTTVSAVELPHRLYSGTDFSTAFFNVSVNPKLTAAQCEQFAFPDEGSTKTDPVASSKIKVGATEYSTMEGIGGKDTAQADAKYYHVFENGTCYEFVLGLETASDIAADGANPKIQPVNRDEVFRKLNWILSTVKIEPVAAPKEVVPEKAATEKTVPEVAADGASVPTDESNQQ
jgi:hypothetical protein